MPRFKICCRIGGVNLQTESKKNLLKQIIRFGFVGGSATLLDYGVMVLLKEALGLDYLTASGISFSVSVIYNYVLSIFWVFQVDKEKSSFVSFVIFLALSLVGLGLNQLLMWLLVSGAGIFYMVSKIAATAVVMIYNFITRKLFLEKR